MTSFFNKLQRGLKVCFAALCMLLLASPATVHAYDFTINGISYDVLSYDELRCEVADVFTKADGAIKIPDTVEFDGRTFRVTSIGNQAFKDCSSLKSIQLPDGITYIGDQAFYNCGLLMSVSLPKGIWQIGDQAFYGCTILMDIQLPDKIRSIGDGTFYGCRALQSIQLPEGVCYIGKEAFYDCWSLKSIRLPDMVWFIGDEAFVNCDKLGEFALPKSIDELGSNLFLSSDGESVPLAKLICTSIKPASISQKPWNFTYDDYYTDYNTFSKYICRNSTLYVPKGSMEAYLKSDWRYFNNIVEYDVEDGIDEVIASGFERKEVGRYDLSGREVDGSHKGITIVRYDDGSATKIYQD